MFTGKVFPHIAYVVLPTKYERFCLCFTNSDFTTIPNKY